MPKWQTAASRRARGHAEAGGHAAEPHLHVELEVLAGVDHVEAGHPEHARPPPARTGGQASSARIATQAASGASISAAPSQKCDRTVNRLAIAVAEQKRQHRQRGQSGIGLPRQEQQRAGHETQRAEHREDAPRCRCEARRLASAASAFADSGRRAAGRPAG